MISTVSGYKRRLEHALKTKEAMLAFVALLASILGIGFSVIGVGPGLIECSEVASWV